MTTPEPPLTPPRPSWRARYQRLDQRSGGWLGLLGEAVREFYVDDGGTRAAAIGYYALFSLFPLTVLLALGLAAFVGESRPGGGAADCGALPADGPGAGQRHR